MMRVSQSGIDLIKRFEGLRLEAYPDPASGGEPWTIGYGTTRTPAGPVTPGMLISPVLAEEYLRDDLRYFESRVNDLVKVPLSQAQFDALVSLTYNIGAGALERSTLLRELNAGNYQEAGEQFLRWNQAAGKTIPGLTVRRTQERNLFMQAGPTSMPETPSIASPPTPAPAPAPYIDPMESPEERRAREDWDRRTRAQMESTGLTADAPTPSTDAAPVPSQGGSMPLPAAAILALGGELLKLLPFAQKAPQKVEQAEAIAAQLVKIAQAAAGPGAVNEQAAVDTVRANPQARAAFVASAAQQWADIAPQFAAEEKSRADARAFGLQALDGAPLVRAFGFGIILFVLSLGVIFGGGYLLGRVLFEDGTDLQTRGMIIGAVIAAATQVLSYFFGSSATSRAKDQTIQDQAQARR